jgi:hypothetical protein
MMTILSTPGLEPRPLGLPPAQPVASRQSRYDAVQLGKVPRRFGQTPCFHPSARYVHATTVFVPVGPAAEGS